MTPASTARTMAVVSMTRRYADRWVGVEVLHHFAQRWEVKYITQSRSRTRRSPLGLATFGSVTSTRGVTAASALSVRTPRFGGQSIRTDVVLPHLRELVAQDELIRGRPSRLSRRERRLGRHQIEPQLVSTIACVSQNRSGSSIASATVERSSTSTPSAASCRHA